MFYTVHQDDEKSKKKPKKEAKKKKQDDDDDDDIDSEDDVRPLLLAACFLLLPLHQQPILLLRAADACFACTVLRSEVMDFAVSLLFPCCFLAVSLCMNSLPSCCQSFLGSLLIAPL